MIKVVIKKNTEGSYTGFKLSGHAGYAESGSDIICSAVSVLVINTINSIDEFTNTSFKLSEDEKKGIISVTFDTEVCEKAILLLDSMVLGLHSIMEDGNEKYIQISEIIS